MHCGAVHGELQPVEGLTSETFMENHFPCEGPLAGARKECEEEEATQTTCDELTVILVSYPPVQLREEVKNIGS